MGMHVHPLIEEMEGIALTAAGRDVLLGLTQVSGKMLPCQLLGIEDCCLSARSSLTPRSVSSPPGVVVTLIRSARPQIKTP